MLGGRIFVRRFSSFINKDSALLVPRFEKILGAENVKTTASIREQHSHDESHHPEKQPDMVVMPRSVEQVSAIIKLCNESRVPVVPFGAGSGLEGGVNAVAGGVCFDMMQMNEVVEVNTEDFDCVVKAGVTRKQLNSHLHDTGLFFPVDPGADASVCAMAATCASVQMQFATEQCGKTSSILRLFWLTAIFFIRLAKDGERGSRLPVIT
uniref:FAD-binding PCMH-type domain-containing protein n=1 Tax=Parascaris univalens TaxID=6257 RepID=A0A915CKD9_PARUN